MRTLLIAFLLMAGPATPVGLSGGVMDSTMTRKVVHVATSRRDLLEQLDEHRDANSLHEVVWDGREDDGRPVQSHHRELHAFPGTIDAL